jgi:hypothetical protein
MIFLIQVIPLTILYSSTEWNPQAGVKVAVHDYKVRTFQQKVHPVQPDFYCRKLVVNTPEDDIWIHYLSHELVGLTEEEIHTYYTKDDPELKDVFNEMDLS